MEILTQIVSAGIASAGFSLVYCLHHHLKFNIVGGILGMVSWAIYLAVFEYSSYTYLAYFVGSVGVGILSEICARIFKVPTITFLIVAIFPLVPGGRIYQTMLYAIDGKNDLFISALIDTFGISLSIALAILFSSTLFNVYKRITYNKQVK